MPRVVSMEGPEAGMLYVPEVTMRFSKRSVALVGLLAAGVLLPSATDAGEGGKTEVTNVLVELTPPTDRDDVWGKEVILCWETAPDVRWGFAVDGGFTPPDLDENLKGIRETFQKPGLAVEIDKRRTEELSSRLAKERVTVVVLRLAYHSKLQAGSWSFGVHGVPARTGGPRLLGKVRLLVGDDRPARPAGKGKGDG